MMPTTLNLADIIATLKDVGIKTGDHLMMHASMVPFYRIDIGIEKASFAIIDAILELIGSRGTLVVPTFTLSFSHSKYYHETHSPSEAMGLLSENVRLNPNAKRTHHPMQSLCSIGYYQKQLDEIMTPSAYMQGSTHDFIYKNNFKLLLLGVDGRAATISHLAEETMNVPYRFNKTLTGDVSFKDKKPLNEWHFFARNLDCNPIINENHTMELLKRKNLWIGAQTHSIPISCCDIKTYMAELLTALEENPYFLVTNADEVKEFCRKKTFER